MESTERIRNRNSIFVALVYTSAYQILWVRERKTKISKTPYCLTSLCRAYQEYLFQALFFMDFKVWLYRVESCKYLYPAVNLYWFFWLHWSEIFIPKMLSSVAINSSYYSCFNLQVISYKKQKIQDVLLSRRNHKFLWYCFFIKLE